MGLFKSRPENGASDTLNIRGIVSNQTEDDGDLSKLVDFPTIDLGRDDDFLFDEIDITVAKELMAASREQLLGTAALYLAVAENETEASYASIAMAYIAFANTRP